MSTATMDINLESERDTAESMVSIRSLQKSFRRKSGEIVTAIDNVTLDLAPGEFLVLLGPSGCGKTTLLRTIAGLEVPDSGTIEVHGRTVFDKEFRIALPAEKRDLGMVFQSYALWPHMTVAKNVAYPLKARNKSLGNKAIAEKVERLLGLLGLSDLAESHPSQLSGGQQQRVALARALAGGRQLILFDEPLSNVDAKVRETLRRELKIMQKQLGFSAIYVTHDQTEAMELADRIAVVNNGRIEQLADPQTLYDAPVSRYVADFIGAANLIDGRVISVESNGMIAAETSFGTVISRGVGFAPGDNVVLLARPERCEVVSKKTEAANAWKVTVRRRVFYGAHVEVEVKAERDRMRAWIKDGSLGREATEAWIQIRPDHILALRP